MKVCTKCILPETYPGIQFNNAYVCNFCETGFIESIAGLTENRKNLLQKLSGLKNEGHNTLIPISGGVNSCLALENILASDSMKPLALHNILSLYDGILLENAKKISKLLDVDLIIWQENILATKKFWNVIHNSTINELKATSIFYQLLLFNMVELALVFKLPSIIANFSPIQVRHLSQLQTERKILENLMDELASQNDRQLIEAFSEKMELLDKYIIINKEEEFTRNIDSNRLLLVPYYLFNYPAVTMEKSTDIFINTYRCKIVENAYPAYSNNSYLNWLTADIDINKHNYTYYHEHYSQLIRSNALNREIAVKHLMFDPSLNILDKMRAEYQIKTILKKAETARTMLNDGGDFDFS